jgi:hypothetical protein
MFGALPGAASSIKDGQLRALAVTSGKRDPGFPDVPTLAEAGVPDQESEFIQGVLVPAGTPKDIIDKLYREDCPHRHAAGGEGTSSDDWIHRGRQHPGRVLCADKAGYRALGEGHS